MLPLGFHLVGRREEEGSPPAHLVRVVATHQLSAEASWKVILLLHPQDEDPLSEQLTSVSFMTSCPCSQCACRQDIALKAPHQVFFFSF